MLSPIRFGGRFSVLFSPYHDSLVLNNVPLPQPQLSSPSPTYLFTPCLLSCLGALLKATPTKADALIIPHRLSVWSWGNKVCLFRALKVAHSLGDSPIAVFKGCRNGSRHPRHRRTSQDTWWWYTRIRLIPTCCCMQIVVRSPSGWRAVRERMSFSRCIISRRSVLCLFLNPPSRADTVIRQSPGMVIVEIDRYFDRFESVLGMHSWSQFLKRPTDEEMDKSSKVFWCVYNSGRLVQKNGGSFR